MEGAEAPVTDSKARVGAVDIGTNTVRLMVADVDERGDVVWVARRAVVTRLGQGVDQHGALDPEAIERTCRILAEYADQLVEGDCLAVRAVATSAVRDAVNSAVFVEAACAALGFEPEVITGAEEAALGFSGTTGHLHIPGPFLVIDPGGGSTEFVFGEGSPSYAVSVDIGSVRLTERLLHDHPVAPAALAAARMHAHALLDDGVELPGAPEKVYGVAGTFTSLAAMHLGLPAHDSDEVHGTELTGDQLHDLTDRLAAMSLDRIAAIPSMDPQRAPVIVGGAVVAEQALAITGVDTITISERDSLDGLVRQLAATLVIDR